MTIIRTNPTADFVQITNALTDTPMQFKAKDIILHLISKPPSWKVIPAAICKALELSKYIVKKSLTWLRKHGYAFYKHCHTGYGEWIIFDTPQPKNATAPVIPPKLVIPTLAFAPPLEINKEPVILKEQQHEPIPEPIQQKTVVVSLAKEIKSPKQVIKEGLKFPDNFTESQVKDAKRTLKRLDMPELAQAILLQLAADILSGAIRTTIPRYLGGLVKTANEQGSFTYAQAAGATNKGGNPLIPYFTAKPQPPTSTRSIGKAAAAAARALLR